MSDQLPTPPPETFHRFLDETGDTTFYGKGRKLIVGQDGVSLSFGLGEVRHYNYLAEKIRLVVDLYDREKYDGSRNYYDKKNPLTAGNKLGPPVT